MWEILSINGNDEYLKIPLCNHEYTVGRKDCDLVIQNDPSISRKHASFKSHHTEVNVMHSNNLPTLVLTEASKLGTVINNNRVRGADHQLSSGDEISFGTTGNNKFRVNFVPFLVTTSCVSGAVKRQVRSCLCRIGGHLIPDWSRDCNLLIMSSLSVTIKVIAALLSQKYIVTPNFLDDLVTSFEQKQPRPAERNYLPPIAESQLDPDTVSFEPNPQRNTVFQGKLFLFLSLKQLKKLELVIELGGGTPMLLDAGDGSLEDLQQPHALVMQLETNEASQMPQQQQDWYKKVSRELIRLKKRFITDSEIGLAVLHCSTQEHCNPSQSLGATFTQTMPSQTQAAGSVQHTLAPNTENFTQQQQKRSTRTRVGDVTHIDETVVKVKEEPLTPRTQGVKRSAPETTSESTTPAKKICVKEERPTGKPTPRIPAPTVDDDLFADSEEDNNPTNSFTAPQPVDEPAFIDDFAGIPSGRRKTKTPAVSRRAPPESEVKTEVDVSASDFDEIPRRKNRKLTQATTASVVTQNVTQQSSVAPMEFEEVSDFSAVPSRRKASTRTKAAEVAIAKEVSAPNIKPTTKSEPAETNTKPTAKSRNTQQETRQQDHVEASSSGSRRVESQEDGTFVSSVMPNEETLRNADTVTVKEEGLPTACAVIQYAALVCQRPAGFHQHRTVQDRTTWKGKTVKNFKKFRKTLQSSEELPFIIGGSDLVVHEKKTAVGLDDWFKEQLEMESQQQEKDRVAEEFFDSWGPTVKRRR